MRSIGFIVDQEYSKYSKDTNKNSQCSSAKTKEKDTFDMGNLTKSLKLLINEVSKLERKSSEVFKNNKSFKLFLKENYNQLAKSVQSSNVVFNVENLGMYIYYTFHQDPHSEKTCLQWKHNMNVMVSNVIESLSAEEN